MIHFIVAFNRQGTVRLQKWYNFEDIKTVTEKKRIIKDLTNKILTRNERTMCNFLEWRNLKVVYKRYASLFFMFAISPNDNELITLEVIHRYVEVLDQYFGCVCELDIIYDFEKAYFILDELIVAGEIQDTSKKAVLKQIEFADSYQEEEIISLALKDVGLI